MSNECYVETLEEMVTELKDNGGDIQNGLSSLE